MEIYTTRWDAATNPVERGFATMKRHYGFTRLRHIGLARNAGATHVMCAAINLRRALVLAA